jgi:hypothetical protein
MFLYLCWIRVRCRGTHLPSRCLETALVYLLISRSLPSNGSTRYSIVSPHRNHLQILRSSSLPYGKVLWSWINRAKSFDRFTHFQHPQNTKMWFFNAFCLSASLCVRLSSAWTARRILFIFCAKNFYRGSVLPGECWHSSSKRNTKLLFSRKLLLQFWLNFSNPWRSSP